MAFLVLLPSGVVSRGLPLPRIASTAFAGGEGDSIAQATPYHVPTESFHRWFAEELGVSYYSHGVGGTQTDTIKARTIANVLPTKPTIVFVEGGVNDLYYRDTSSRLVANDDATIQNLKDTVVACINSGVPLVVYCPITPWTGGSDTKNLSADYINATMIAWLASTYPTQSIVCDMRPLLGEFRAGGAEGNYWNIQPQFAVDSDTLGVHFNRHAYQVWGRHAASLVLDFFSIPKPLAPSALTVDDSANTIDWTNAPGFILPSNYEWSNDEEVTWQTCTAKPQPVGDVFRFAGRLALRTKGSPRASSSIYSSTPLRGSRTLLTFPSLTTTTITNGVVVPLGSGFGNTGLSDKKLAAGTSGRVMCQYSEFTAANFILGFSLSNTQGSFSTINAGFRLYADGLVETFEGGTHSFIPEPGWVNYNDWVCVYRNGSTLKIQRSTDDGATWTDMATLTFSSAQDLFVNFDCYAPLGRIFYVSGENLV